MIQFIEGNLFESKAEALVNTVNTFGVMGKGIALQFKNQYPNNYKLYEKACRAKEIRVGKLFVTEEASLLGDRKIIINFPTKTDWRKPSEYCYIESGLKELVRIITENKIQSVAIPPLGAGNGGLEWNRVKILIEKYLTGLICDIQVYEPNAIIREAMKKERVKLTPARAMLLSVLYELVRNSEFVSEFSAEKAAYFLQRFGAKDQFKLDFLPYFYGPYSGKVKHVLYYLNGSYITGYSSKNKKPFEELGIMFDGENEIKKYLEQTDNIAFKEISDKTKAFLTGFYSAFGLELLSTVDYIMSEKKANTTEEVSRYIESWSDRKKSLFSNPKFIDIAVNKLEKTVFVS
ncbi:MAG TPA: Appr-1-p processing protein [Bacteroidales bacterium]|nr:MAG: Appr-1-p processing protein [Bacteroidetes bacterium GWE2_42_24]OFY26352.1 MAG: Appr-1-p processing protein [Bacteroidetes bacterium GWF2_43_11]HAQ65587.1 Appr-1-p processing protein [Bacteroidales bacterium]HBZ66892.1 Appr-1-p processing protein [Bacteroidales bacterium]